MQLLHDFDSPEGRLEYGQFFSESNISPPIHVSRFVTVTRVYHNTSGLSTRFVTKNSCPLVPLWKYFDLLRPAKQKAPIAVQRAGGMQKGGPLPAPKASARGTGLVNLLYHILVIIKARPPAAQSFRAISIQQRIASKLTLYNPARVWYNKGTKCGDMDRMLLHQKFISSH